MTTVEYSTTPPPDPAPGRPDRPAVNRISPRVLLPVVGLVLAGLFGWAATRAGTGPGGAATVTLLVFAAAVWFWTFTKVDDTYIALGAATLLVLAGVIDTSELFATLGDETVWLLLAAFVIAAGLTSSGLTRRAAAFVVAGAGTPRQLVHLVTASMVVTTYAMPSTSGRAALAVPVFTALAAVLAERPKLVRALSVLIPSVILLSAVGSLLGAGAHLVTSQVVAAATGEGFSFVTWMLLGLPLALACSHVCAEIVLWMFTDRAERRAPVHVSVADLDNDPAQPVTGPLTVYESRAALLLAAVVTLWCTEPLHHVHPAIVALIGALVATSPRYGATTLNSAFKTVPWSMLLFLSATLALGTALTTTGAAEWVAGALLGPFTGGTAPGVFLVVIVLVSAASHLLIQSRSARSAVLIPVIVALAPLAGVNPAAAAFASTAAAGFCHTLPSSAKPVGMFARLEGVPTYTPPDLLRLSAVLAPATIALVLVFTWFVWPLLGLPVLQPR
ncbi:SLC13 family permease [Actinoplanes couchii]|uniref:Transporter n=1 Tax=Actinoplanes couchii TaxID=403638 RepID=A0ABQ3XRI2_9ACTN|nr:SLC13 family permease [Actinoplanes couchii]MDR6318211.1 anion transporter [Actinoplanes couchii]GID61005.1 transporter [Actinoplanes couchii]